MPYGTSVQGYLAHKKSTSPLEPPQGPGHSPEGGAVFISEVPLYAYSPLEGHPALQGYLAHMKTPPPL